LSLRTRLNDPACAAALRCAAAGGLRTTRVNFHQRSVTKDKEYWRSITSALAFDKPGW
jgi:hypothetical protein